MFTYQTTRDQTAFDSFSSYSTQSITEGFTEEIFTNDSTGGIYTIPGSTTSASSSFGTYYTQDSGGTTQIFSSDSSTGSDFATIISNSTGVSYTETFSPPQDVGTSTAVSSYSTSAQTADVPTSAIGTTDTTTIALTLSTTSTFTDTWSVYTTTTDSSDNVTITTAQTTTMFTGVSSSGTYISSDYYGDTYSTTTVTSFTATGNGTVTFVTAYATESLTAPYEIGTVIVAEASEWLWSFSGTCNNSIMTDIASSFTQTTFWQSLSSATYNFITDSNSVATTLIGDASITAFTTQVVGITASTYTTTITTDNTWSSSGTDTTTIFTDYNIPRATTTLEVDQTTTLSSGSFTAGYASYSVVLPIDSIDLAYRSYTASVKLTVSTTYSGTSFAQVGLNTSTFSATLASTTTNVYTAIQITQDTPYQTGSSISGISTGISWGVFKASTSFYAVYSSIVPMTNAATYYQQIPGIGGMRTPQSMKQSDTIGTNINLSVSIFYPFAFSAQQNVVVPVTYNGSTVQIDTAQTSIQTLTSTYSSRNSSTTSTYTSFSYTNVTNWSYSWKDFSLSWTSATSTTSTNGVSSGSSSSFGAMAVTGDDNSSYWQTIQASVLGGYTPISSMAASAVFLPGAFTAISYDTAGSTTTDKGLRTTLMTSTLSKTVRVESVLPAFSVITLLESDIFTFSLFTYYQQNIPTLAYDKYDSSTISYYNTDQL